MVVPSQSSKAVISTKVPEFNRQVHRGGSQVGSFWGEGQVGDGMSMTLQRTNVVSTFVIPDLFLKFEVLLR
jgi:hypothetical protein